MFHLLRAFGVISQRRNCQVSARTSCPAVGFWKPGFIDRTDGSSVREDGGEHLERWQLSQANPMEVRLPEVRKDRVGPEGSSVWCRGPLWGLGGCDRWTVCSPAWRVCWGSRRVSSSERAPLCFLEPSGFRLPLGERRRESPSFESDSLGVGRNSQYPLEFATGFVGWEGRADLIWFGEILNLSLVKGNPCLPHLEACERKAVTMNTTQKVQGAE